MTPQENIKNNDFLLSLDMKDASREQKISWLCQIIKNENEKPEDQRDFNLIVECAEFLQELSGPEAAPNQEQMDRILLEIKANHPASKEIEVSVAKRPRKLLKIMAAAAVLVVMLFSALTVAAKIQGYSTAWEFVYQNVGKILNMNSGDTIEQGNITLIKGTESIVYSSMEELIIAENYNIFYPSNLPENIQIQRITQQYMSDGSMTLSFQMSDIDFSFSISSKTNISEEDLLHLDIYKTPHNLTFYINKTQNNIYQAIGHFENCEYSLLYTDYDVLILILDSMKGIEK